MDNTKTKKNIGEKAEGKVLKGTVVSDKM